MQKEVERIYELTKSLNMVVIDCDVINHPSQLTDCSLAPISIYIKMEPQILEKLVKLRGSKRKNLGAQVVAAQKLAQCNEVSNSLQLYLQRNSFITRRYMFVTQRYMFVTQRYMFVTRRYMFVTQRYISRYVHTIPDSFACRHVQLSGVVWTPIRYVTLHLRDRRGAALLSYRYRPENTVVCVNRGPIQYGFHAGAKAIRYSVNITWNTFERDLVHVTIQGKGVRQ